MSIKQKINNMIRDGFVDYANWTVTTSIHKSREHAIACCLLGLVGEVREYEEKLMTSPHEIEEIQMELGDVLYYLGHFVYRVGMQDKVRVYEVLNDEVIDNGMPYVIAHLCEAFKKVIRDDDYEVVGSRKEQEVYEHVNNLLTLIVSEHDIDEMDFLETLSLNKEKLTSRKDRGVIKGDGDNR